MRVIFLIIKKHWVASLVVVAVIAAIIVNVALPVKHAVVTESSGSYGGVASGLAVRAPGLAYDTAQNVGAPSIAPMPPEPYPSAGQTAADVDQKIIKTGSLTLEVKDVSNAVSRITDVATTAKGFVQESSVSEQADGTHAGEITVRVPASAYDATMSQIKAVASLVKYESSTGQDVTEQYTDLQARLRNAQAQEQTYLEILKQAKTVTDTLNVQQQLGAIRGDIESMQGRIQYLENVTSYSTITVSVMEAPTVRAPSKSFQPLDDARAAVQMLVNAFQGIASALITFVIVGGGILIPVALIIWLIWTLAKRLKRV